MFRLTPATKDPNAMKSQLRNLSISLLAVCAILGGMIQGQAQITVQVDSTKNWVGYMNWYSINDVWVQGSGWGIADLRAKFLPAKANATRVLLQVNTNTFKTDGYWNLPDGTPNKHLEANFYVDVGTLYAGQQVTFVGTVESNSLPAGWTCWALIKEFAPGYAYLGDTRVPVVAGAFNVSRTIGAGNITQYGFLTYGPNAAPGTPATLQAVSILVNNADPSITAAPVNQRAVVGGTASFSVVAVGASPLSYHWQRYSTNLLNSAKFSGATSSTLTISNAQLADATTYSVIVTDTAGSVTNAARLQILTPAEFANALDNPSFELNYDAVNAFQVVPAPWINFSGSALLSGGDFPWSTPVDGTNVVQVYNAGQYNGSFQDVPASPGDVFTGDGWLFQSSFDPLTAPTNEAYLEVQFRQGNNAPIAIYHSATITNDIALQDAWLFLEATNGVAAGYAQTSTSNAKYLVAPAGTDHVRYQITLHKEGAGSGSVFVDVMRLMKKIPVTVATSVSGGSVTLSWLSQGATDYQVVYKDNLTDLSWTPIGGLIAGDGSVKSASFATTLTKRFYSVLTK